MPLNDKHLFSSTLKFLHFEPALLESSWGPGSRAPGISLGLLLASPRPTLRFRDREPLKRPTWSPVSFQAQRSGKHIPLRGETENRVVAASGEYRASGDSCSSARQQAAAAWEPGQGRAGRARPPQARSLSWQIQIVGAGSGWRLVSGFHAVLTVSLVNAEQMGEGRQLPRGQLWPSMSTCTCGGHEGLPYRWCDMGSSTHEPSLTPLHTQGWF